MQNRKRTRQEFEAASLGVGQVSKNDGQSLKQTVDSLIETNLQVNRDLELLANRTTMLTGTPDATSKSQMSAVIKEMNDIFKELNKNNQTLKQGLSKVQKGVQDLSIDNSENVKPSSIKPKGP